MTVTPPTTDITGLPPRIPLREQIATRILDYKCPVTGKNLTTRPEFDAWMARSWNCEMNATDGKALVRERATAKAMLATWIEARLKAPEGVWFGNSDTQFTIGLVGRPSISVDVPAWMTAYIQSYPTRPKSRS